MKNTKKDSGFPHTNGEGMAQVGNIQAYPAVLTTLVVSDFMGPHFINMLCNLHISYIFFCVFQILP